MPCYGILWADTGGMMLRFAGGRPVSQVTDGVPGLGLTAVGGRGQACVAAGLGQRLLARQRPCAGLDLGPQPQGDGCEHLDPFAQQLA